MAVGTSYIVTGFVPKRDYPFVLGQRVYTIPLPTIVYRAKWHDGQISKLELAITLEDEPQEDTQLYRWPFSNVYDHLGVCWSTSQAECQALKDVVEKGVFGFLQTPNNADLFRSAQCSSYESYSDFLQVVEQEGLHKEWLKPLTFTVAELHNKH